MTTTTTTTSTRLTTPGPIGRRGTLVAALALTFVTGIGLAYLTVDDPSPRASTVPSVSQNEPVNGSDVHLYNQADEIELARRCQQAGD